MPDPTRTQCSCGYTAKPCLTPGCMKSRNHGGDCTPGNGEDDADA